MPVQEKIIPRYSLEESSSSGSSMFEIVESKGDFLKRRANFLVPHRKDYYLLVLVKKGNSRHWLDFVPYTIRPNTFYFTHPDQVHVKEQSEPLHGIVVSFTEEFLQMDENLLLSDLPIIQNPDNQHELSLKPHDVAFLEDLLRKMMEEF